MDIGIRDASLTQAGFATAVDGLRALGLQVLEVNFPREGVVPSPAGGEPVTLDEAGAARYREALEQSGIRVCALLCAQNFGLQPPDAEIDWIVRAVRAAEAVGIPAIRVDSAMARQTELPLEDRITQFADATRHALDATDESAVRLGIENHGRQGNEPAWMDGVLQRVNSPRLGLTLDVGNWYWFGHPLSHVYEIYRKYAPHTVHTHVKSIRYPIEMREQQREIGYKYGEYCCPLDEGDLDFARAIRILRDGGYNGDLVIEDESLGKFPLDQRREVLQRDVATLRQAIAATGAP